jgi:4-hydroxy-tetrahydrodipicolinate synthase
LLAPVSYTPLNDEEVFEHFSTVARESGLPLCIYDNPGTTHFKFSAALVGRLSRVRNVVAVKSPAPDSKLVSEHVATLRGSVPEGFSLGYSVDWHVAEALLAGGDVWYSVAGGLFPKSCGALVRAAQRGDVAEARRLNAALEPLWALFREFSSLRVVYAIANQLEICDSQPPRPILPLSEPVQRKITETLRGLNLN